MVVNDFLQMALIRMCPVIMVVVLLGMAMFGIACTLGMIYLMLTGGT